MPWTNYRDGKCTSMEEYKCKIWKASFKTAGDIAIWTCQGCDKGSAHEHTMKLPHELDLRVPRYAPIDGQDGGR